MGFHCIHEREFWIIPNHLGEITALHDTQREEWIHMTLVLRPGHGSDVLAALAEPGKSFNINFTMINTLLEIPQRRNIGMVKMIRACHGMQKADKIDECDDKMTPKSKKCLINFTY